MSMSDFFPQQFNDLRNVALVATYIEDIKRLLNGEGGVIECISCKVGGGPKKLGNLWPKPFYVF